jgi:hypothetical protein
MIGLNHLRFGSSQPQRRSTLWLEHSLDTAIVLVYRIAMSKPVVRASPDIMSGAPVCGAGLGRNFQWQAIELGRRGIRRLRHS